MQYSNTNELTMFLEDCETELFKHEKRKQVDYPSGNIAPWNSDAIGNANKDLLDLLSKEANVYAIFVANADSDDYELKYIGQTKAKLARTRLTNHLVKKHEKTGAKLSKIIDHVQSNGKVKISWIQIEPETLRHYVEEALIIKHPESSWNKHGRKQDNVNDEN